VLLLVLALVLAGLDEPVLAGFDESVVGRFSGLLLDLDQWHNPR